VCQWPTDTGICRQPATDVDHITPAHLGGSNEDANLQALCSWHHARKTSQEANAARPPRPPRARLPELHPGVLRDE
jgi:5-methylcytosine-specific restriction endonuclease McrA